MCSRLLFLFVLIVYLSSCKEKELELISNNCKASPSFLRILSGFNPSKSYFSTSDVSRMGLVLVENSGTTYNPQLRYFQHPSWKKAGWLAPIQIDGEGNIYTAPAPFISV